jgi:hypothetical protein
MQLPLVMRVHAGNPDIRGKQGRECLRALRFVCGAQHGSDNLGTVRCAISEITLLRCGS